MAHAYNPGALEVESEKSEIQVQPQIHGDGEMKLKWAAWDPVFYKKKKRRKREENKNEKKEEEKKTGVWGEIRVQECDPGVPVVLSPRTQCRRSVD